MQLLLVFYLLLDPDRTPLIVDQPEQNLDNESVYKLLVPCLREARKRRQVIVVTHNPNLAITCDAEQLIHAEFNKATTRVTYNRGSIENPRMNRFGVNVLEGSLPAFRNRERKWQDDSDGGVQDQATHAP